MARRSIDLVWWHQIYVTKTYGDRCSHGPHVHTVWDTHAHTDTSLADTRSSLSWNIQHTIWYAGRAANTLHTTYTLQRYSGSRTLSMKLNFKCECIIQSTACFLQTASKCNIGRPTSARNILSVFMRHSTLVEQIKNKTEVGLHVHFCFYHHIISHAIFCVLCRKIIHIDRVESVYCVCIWVVLLNEHCGRMD